MEFPERLPFEKVIIAMKGLPFTFKSEMASQIGEWARCPVLYIDHFLCAVSLEKGYSSTFMPSEEEAERLHRLAFHALCKSGHRHLQYKRRVVIKSRLYSTFELDHLLQLSREIKWGRVTIIIIEFRIKNEHRFSNRLEYRAKRIPEDEKEWYKAWSRLDLEKARDDWLHSQPNWDLHPFNLINDDKRRQPARVVRLVSDPFDDLNLYAFGSLCLTPSFRDAISYLLTRQHGAQEEDWIGEEIIRDRYEVVQFDKLRRYLVEKELRRASTSGQKSIYLCPTTRVGKCCVFKTCTEEELHHHSYYNCGVCDERVVSAGYTCHFCILTLHKSCAELQGFNFLGFKSNPWLNFYPNRRWLNLPRTYACMSCAEAREHFSDDCKSCLFQMHLKCRKFPTIINHDSHHHPLSLQLHDQVHHNDCKPCGKYIIAGKYGCYLCGLYYCFRCVSRPLKVEHKHGGHKHVMKLVYSRDGMEPEEDYWCGVCYKYMDPQLWFYSCQDCPYYAAHAECIALHYSD